MKQFHLCFLVLLLSSGQGYADVLVNSVSSLVAAVNNTAHGGDSTILIANGTYNLGGSYLRITTDGVTVRSASGDRSTVTLDGNRQTTEIFQILASHVTIKDMTLKNAQDHLVHVMGGLSEDITEVLLHNLHIIDPGQQAIKINPNAGYSTENSTISDCLIELTDPGRAYVWAHNGSCYTGGIDGHSATGWDIRDNIIKGFWCSGGLSEHAVHFWSGSSDTLVERNLILDCDRGIGFGLGSSPHYGGIIRNNIIWQIQNHGYSDVGIGLESATNVQMYNNTIFLGHDYPNAIEYRFAASTDNKIINNLSNKLITSRQRGEAEVEHNVTTASPAWFINTATGDLHLQGEIAEVINQGINLTGLLDDFDKGIRPCNGGIDIGADEYNNLSCPNNSKIFGFSPSILLLLQDSN